MARVGDCSKSAGKRSVLLQGAGSGFESRAEEQAVLAILVGIPAEQDHTGQ